jgi:ribose transport system ATP-binding protein
VHVVHQDPCVFDNASVAENLALGPGFLTGVGGRIRWREMEKRAQAVLDQFEIHAGPGTLVAELRGAERTKIAIARALQDADEYSEGLLILDEPTAALPREEIDKLIEWIRMYAAGDRSLIFVSHRIDEVLGLANRVSVLRDGELVETCDRASLDESALVELITGRNHQSIVPGAKSTLPPRSGVPALEIDGLAGGAVRDVSLTLQPGEILGIAGLLGAGRTTLLELIFGVRRPMAGAVRIHGQPLSPRSPEDGVRAGLMYVPESRSQSGFYGMSVCANLSAAVVKRYAPFGRFKHRLERSAGAEQVKRYSIRTHSLNTNLEDLSGGNQQKVIMARSISAKPRILLLDEPTQGVDVGARSDIHRFLTETAAQGVSVLIVSSDLEELALVADRIIVLRDGRIAGEITGPKMTEDDIVTAVYEGGPADDV